MKTDRGLNTCVKELPVAFDYLRKNIKLLSHFSESLATSLVTKLFCKPIRNRIGEAQHRFYQSGTTDILNIQGYQIKVFRKGNGKAVYIAHGWNSSGYAMRHIVEALVARGFQVIMPDMPCHGRSSGIFIDQIKMSKVIEEILLHYNALYPITQIVTYSWGGTATLLALDRIRKGRRIGFNINKMVSICIPVRPDAIMGQFIKILDLPKKVAKGLKRNIERVAEKDGRSLQEAFPIGLTELLKKERFDYLLLHGQKDSIISWDNSVQLACMFPYIRLRIFDGLGHMNILEDAGVVNAVEHYLVKEATKETSLLEHVVAV